MAVTVIAYDRPMGRWEPDAKGRLERAAAELYGERGFDKTTAADIAARAGLAERTFFRHFADKREVLFGRAGQLQDLLVRSVAEAPASAAPLDAVVAAFRLTGEMFDGRAELSRQRQRIIDAHQELQERELIKMATLSAALTDALRRRGASASEAGLAASAGVAVFLSAFQRWLESDPPRLFAELVDEAVVELRAVTAAPRTRRRRPVAARS